MISWLDQNIWGTITIAVDESSKDEPHFVLIRKYIYSSFIWLKLGKDKRWISSTYTVRLTLNDRETAWSSDQCYGLVIGPLQLVIHVVQIRLAGEQKSHWDKTNKENYHLQLCMSFIFLVPMRRLLSSVAVLHHVMMSWVQSARYLNDVVSRSSRVHPAPRLEAD